MNEIHFAMIFSSAWQILTSSSFNKVGAWHFCRMLKLETLKQLSIVRFFFASLSHLSANLVIKVVSLKKCEG